MTFCRGDGFGRSLNGFAGDPEDIRHAAHGKYTNEKVADIRHVASPWELETVAPFGVKNR